MDSDDLPALYELESIEQMRAIADDLRIRILDLLVHGAMTVTQLGDALGVAPAKAHYHVRELERVGLVRLVETRERGGILEKYYRAIAKDIRLTRSLLQSAPRDETLAAVAAQLQSVSAGFLRAFGRALAGPDGPHGFIQFSSGLVWMTDDELRDVAQRILDLLAPYHGRRPDTDAKARVVVQLGYDVIGDEGTDGAEAVEIGDIADADATIARQPAAGGAAPRRRRVVIAGVAEYSRADLERVVAAGEALDIHTLGALTFAADVPAELADRAVARLRLRGTLTTSPEVRAVLGRKDGAHDSNHVPDRPEPEDTQKTRRRPNRPASPTTQQA